MTRRLQEKLKESLSAVLPIVGIVLLLSFSVASILTEHPALLFNGCCADYCGDDVFHPRCRDVNDADGRADRNKYDQEAGNCGW